MLLRHAFVAAFILVLSPSDNSSQAAWIFPTTTPAKQRQKHPFFFASKKPSFSSSLLSNDDKKKNSVTVVATPPPPPPPWTFQASRIHYTFLAVPTHLAKRYCPTSGKSTPLTLLSAFGYTLGGVFCVEYSHSPVGPYREVAVLAGLVGSLQRLGGIGAWASHIFVNNHQAAQYGQAYWGLPAETIDIDAKKGSDRNESSSNLHVTFGDKEILWKGWNNDKDDASGAKNPMDWFNVSLPSFSGCLALSSTGDNSTGSTATPLLRYPLRIARPHGVSLSSKQTAEYSFALESSVSSSSSTSLSTALEQVKEIIESSRPLVSINVDNVQLEAGIPVQID